MIINAFYLYLSIQIYVHNIQMWLASSVCVRCWLHIVLHAYLLWARKIMRHWRHWGHIGCCFCYRRNNNLYSNVMIESTTECITHTHTHRQIRTHWKWIFQILSKIYVSCCKNWQPQRYTEQIQFECWFYWHTKTDNSQFCAEKMNKNKTAFTGTSQRGSVNDLYTKHTVPLVTYSKQT